MLNLADLIEDQTMPKSYKPSKMSKKVAKKPFEPCSRCPSPTACTKAGKCIAESFA